jgi:hypothetical protein
MQKIRRIVFSPPLEIAIIPSPDLKNLVFFARWKSELFFLFSTNLMINPDAL